MRSISPSLISKILLDRIPTAVAGSVLTSAFWNTNVRDNSLELAPLALPWTAYTPTYTNITIGNGTVTARYLQTGKTVTGGVLIVFGSTTSITGDCSISLPVQEKNSYLIWGSVNYQIAATFRLGVFEGAAQKMYLRVVNASGTYATYTNLSSTVPATWASGSQIAATFVYEAA